uniref:Uncharacterized protein n=1 Tax=Amphimedon queenslandica TaxID=400682 RepID=A0A1X7TL12_AMPQE
QVQLLFLDDDVILMSQVSFYFDVMQIRIQYKLDLHTFIEEDIRFANAVKGQLKRQLGIKST